MRIAASTQQQRLFAARLRTQRLDTKHRAANQSVLSRNVQRSCIGEASEPDVDLHPVVTAVANDVHANSTARGDNGSLVTDISSGSFVIGDVEGSASVVPANVVDATSTQPKSDSIGVAYGFHRDLPAQSSWHGALYTLAASIQELQSNACASAASSGSIRLEVEFPAKFTSLEWLLAHSPGTSSADENSGADALEATAQKCLQVYFSPRHSPQPAADSVCSPTVAGMGAAWLWKGAPGEELTTPTIDGMQRFMHASGSTMKVLGGARFDSRGAVSPEWEPFGSFCMVEGATRHTLVANLVWDADSTSGHGPANLLEASAIPLGLIGTSRTPEATDGTLRPLVDIEASEKVPNIEAWTESVEKLLHTLDSDGDKEGGSGQESKLSEDAIRDFLDGPGGASDLDSLLATARNSTQKHSKTSDLDPDTLQKVVLARCMKLSVRGKLPPLAIVKLLQQRDAASYQFAMILPEGSAFVSATPERLFLREGARVSTEAVAGTRRRGCFSNVREDFDLGMELMSGAKEHNEFVIVREWIESALSTVCTSVSVDISKSLLKLRSVQHLYGRLSGAIRGGQNDADLLAALHPTPAVCGCPQAPAYDYIRDNEVFDRGFYAGPLGYVSANSAEFVVGIRSALISPVKPEENESASSSGDMFQVSLYSGVGVVPGSSAEDEWNELDLKAAQYLRGLKRPPRLGTFPNLPAMHAGMIVDELVRSGVSRFAVAPGSRSSPLMHAIYAHPHAYPTVMLDERSLAFWAVGAATATLSPVAIVTTSGTAVANLLPAVVEAASSHVPLLVLTADRPSELQQCGANQTIDQVKIFGSFVRYACNLPPPEASGSYQPAATLTQVNAAVRHALQATSPGPVHINCQFCEPLAPVATEDSVKRMHSVDTASVATWDNSTSPYTSQICMPQMRSHMPLMPLPSAPSTAQPAGLYSATTTTTPTSSPSSTAPGADLATPPVPPSTWGGSPAPLPRVDTAPVVVDGPLSHKALLSMPSVYPSGTVNILQKLLKSRRGVILAGEIRCPEVRSAVCQLGRFLGWPIVADVLSGLRLGAGPEASVREHSGSAEGGHQATVIHHMDTMLTDEDLKEHIAPDFVLQCGGHVVSKRVMQFFADRARMDGMHWMLVSPSTNRDDERHVVSSFLQCTMHELHALLPSTNQPNAYVTQFSERMACIDSSISYTLHRVFAAASTPVDTSPETCAQVSLSEPMVAYTVATHLPLGHSLFAGNSMPIRDLDMFSTPQHVGATSATIDASNRPPVRAHGALSDVPVAANRGASGIDGVISSAAGFATGLHKPTTLLIGDVSFMHDSNGLMLLRTQPPEAPVTVVLVNNSGGGIFSFLPISSSVPEDEFTEMWATPPNVDLKGICRAHHIPHTQVSSTDDLLPALRNAWALNSSSIVEVTTTRHDNVSVHRKLQVQCTAAAWKVLNWNIRLLEGSFSDAMRNVPDSANPALLGNHAGSKSGNACIECMTVRQFSLPMQRPVTTGSTCSHRNGCTVLLRVRVASGAVMEGSGEASPLPGLHAESQQEAEAQLATLSQLLKGSVIPENISLMHGQMEAWWENVLGVSSASLLPSVRIAVESALVAAMANACGAKSLADHLFHGALADSRRVAEAAPCMVQGAVAVNALMDLTGRSEEEVAKEAQALFEEGFSCIKVKVGRNPEPETDADLVRAISVATGARMSIRADANRLWTLAQALRFATRLTESECHPIEYIEEPVKDPHEIEAFVSETGLKVAVDESLDDGAFLPLASVSPSGHDTGCKLAADMQDRIGCIPQGSVSAIVIKPSLLGSLEHTCALLRWGAVHGVKCVISSTFEGPVGLSVLGSVAAAADALHKVTVDAAEAPGSPVATAHGLGTLSWFEPSSSDDEVSPSWLPVVQECSDVSMRVADMHAVNQRISRMHVPPPHSPPTSKVPLVQSTVSSWELETEVPGGSQACVRILQVDAVHGTHASASGADTSAATKGVLLFMHGFLGAADDWLPVMHGMAACSYECYAMDLPGHGQSQWLQSDSQKDLSLSDYGHIALNVAKALRARSVASSACNVCMVGYSLGGRIALKASSQCESQGVKLGHVIGVSASPGIKGVSQALARRTSDTHLASSLRGKAGLGLSGKIAGEGFVKARKGGLDSADVLGMHDADVLTAHKKSQALADFMVSWYSKPLWESLRKHPRFRAIVARRVRDGDPGKLADSLMHCSSGSQNLWPQVLQSGLGCPVSFVVGELDSKFIKVAKRMVEDEEASTDAELVTTEQQACASLPGVKMWPQGLRYRVLEVAESGHAVHEEQPAALVSALLHLL